MAHAAGHGAACTSRRWTQIEAGRARRRGPLDPDSLDGAMATRSALRGRHRHRVLPVLQARALARRGAPRPASLGVPPLGASNGAFNVLHSGLKICKRMQCRSIQTEPDGGTAAPIRLSRPSAARAVIRLLGTCRKAALGDRQLVAETTHQRMPAHGHRTLSAGFLAMNPKGRLSQPEP